jgi:hypothetical protein
VADERFIVIPEWEERFQNADVAKKSRDGRLPWIKSPVAELADDDYLELSGHRRAVLHGLRLAYASSARRLRLDTRSLSRRLGLRVTMSDLEALNRAGFISFPSRATREESLEPVAIRGEEKRRELPPTQPEPQDVAQRPTNGRAGEDFTKIGDLIPSVMPAMPGDDDLRFDEPPRRAEVLA